MRVLCSKFIALGLVVVFAITAVLPTAGARPVHPRDVQSEKLAPPTSIGQDGPHTETGRQLIKAQWEQRLIAAAGVSSTRDISWTELPALLEKTLTRREESLVPIDEQKFLITGDTYDLVFQRQDDGAWDFTVQDSPSRELFWRHYKERTQRGTYGKANKRMLMDYSREALRLWRSALDGLANQYNVRNGETVAMNMESDPILGLQSSKLTFFMDSLLFPINYDSQLLLLHTHGDIQNPFDTAIVQAILSALRPESKPEDTPPPYAGEKIIEKIYHDKFSSHYTWLFRQYGKWGPSLKEYLAELIDRQYQSGNLEIRFFSFNDTATAEIYTVADTVATALEDYAARLGVPAVGLDAWMDRWNVEIVATDRNLGPLFKAARGIYTDPADSPELGIPTPKHFQKLDNGLIRADERLRRWVKPTYVDYEMEKETHRILQGTYHGVLINNFLFYIEDIERRSRFMCAVSDYFFGNQRTWLCESERPSFVGSRGCLMDGKTAHGLDRWTAALSERDYAARIEKYTHSLFENKLSFEQTDIQKNISLVLPKKHHDLQSHEDRAAYAFDVVCLMAQNISAENFNFLDVHYVRMLLDLDRPEPAVPAPAAAATAIPAAEIPPAATAPTEATPAVKALPAAVPVPPATPPGAKTAPPPAPADAPSDAQCEKFLQELDALIVRAGPAMGYSNKEAWRQDFENCNVVETYLLIFALRNRPEVFRNAVLNYFLNKGVISEAEAACVRSHMDSPLHTTLEAITALHPKASLAAVQNLYTKWLLTQCLPRKTEPDTLDELERVIRENKIQYTRRNRTISFAIVFALRDASLWTGQSSISDMILASDKPLKKALYHSAQAQLAAQEDVEEFIRTKRKNPAADPDVFHYYDFSIALETGEILPFIGPPPPNSAIAALGDATGSMLNEMAKQLSGPARPANYRFMALDSDKNVIEAGKRLREEERAAQNIAPIEFYSGNAAHLPATFADGAESTVIMKSLMNSLHSNNRKEDIRYIVDEIDRILPVGGQVHVVDEGNTPLITYRMFRALGYELVGRQPIPSAKAMGPYLLLSFRKTQERMSEGNRRKALRHIPFPAALRPVENTPECDEVWRMLDQEIPKPQPVFQPVPDPIQAEGRAAQSL